MTAVAGVKHLYVHLPFCAHRCGYCDFVTAVGRREDHAAYGAALLAELERNRDVLDGTVDTVFVGGGTPTYTEPATLARILAALPPAAEVTVEANPETVTPALVELVLSLGVTRVSLGAQSFRAQLLDVLERRATPDQVRHAFATLRAAGCDNVSVDLIYGIPGQTVADLDADLDDVLDLAPDHVSAYELEAKPGTRFTHAWGSALQAQAEELETYIERVVDRLVDAGYRWYETANFARSGSCDRRARHNLAVWRGSDYLGIGVGAVSTVGTLRRRNAPSVPRYVAAATSGADIPSDHEELTPATRTLERIMLALRLDEPLPLAGVEQLVDTSALERLVAAGLVERQDGTVTLTRRGRLLGDAVTAELLL